MWLKPAKKKDQILTDDHPLHDRERSLGITGMEEIRLYNSEELTGEEWITTVLTGSLRTLTAKIRVQTGDEKWMYQCPICRLFVLPEKAIDHGHPCCDVCADQYRQKLQALGLAQLSFFQLMEYIQIAFPDQLAKLRSDISEWHEKERRSDEAYRER